MTLGGEHMANILICDDEQDIVNALKIYLNDPDYVLFEAHNGKEAVETVRENEIHLVLRYRSDVANKGIFKCPDNTSYC